LATAKDRRPESRGRNPGNGRSRGESPSRRKGLLLPREREEKVPTLSHKKSDRSYSACKSFSFCNDHFFAAKLVSDDFSASVFFKVCFSLRCHANRLELRQTRFFFPRKFSYGLKMFFLMNYD
jgi:hypothetical protein